MRLHADEDETRTRAFLDGGGEMGALMRAHDWAATSLGSPETWPASLRTAVRIMLNTGHPMYIWWGPELACLYNDAYRRSIGPERHPVSLGRPGRDVWDEIWDIIGPQIQQVMSGGGATWHENQLVPITRNGRREDVYWTYSYSPIDNPAAPNGVGGVLVVCTETTEAVLAQQELAEQSQRQRRLFEQAPGFICTLRGPDHVFEFANESYKRLVGDRPLLGLPVRQAIPEIEGQGFFERLDGVYRTGERFVGDQLAVQLVRLPGERPEHRVLDFIYEPIFDAENRVTGIFVEGYDMTERTRAETALAESEARLRLVQAAGGIGSFDYDLQTDETICSPEYHAMFGLPVGAPVNRESWLAAVHPDDRAQVLETLERATTERVPFTYEYRALRADSGEVRWITGRAAIVFDAAGEPVRLVGGNIDITPHKQAEARRRALIELNDRFRDLEDPGDLAFAAAEVLGRTLGVSRAGYGDVDPVAETITIERDWNAPGIKSLAGVLHFRDYGSYIEDLKRGETVVFADAETDPRTAATADALKGISAQAVVNMPISERSGLVGLLYLNHETAREWTDDELALVREVAERTRSAIARREAEENLRALAASLESKVEERTAELVQAQEALRQSQKLEAMGQLTGGVAHDFNNLLTPIIGSLDLLHRRAAGSEREQRLIDGALLSAERAKTLVQRLLAFARRQPLQPRPVDVGALVEGMADLVSSTSGPRTRVTVDVAPAVPAAIADPNQLEMAILNLSVNARDAMPDGGRLSITVGAETVERGHRSGLTPGRYVSLCVADSGVGMDPATLKRAIEPFFSTKGLGKGTGLGLSMVHGLVVQLGGAMLLSSRPGLGTQVELWLPATEARAASEGRPPAAEASRATGRALLVDDEELVRASTAHMLGELGYDVAECGSADEALRRISSGEPFDLLVTDHLMPGMTGTELGRRVSEARPDLRVLVISGYADLDGIAPDLPRLTKPFRQAELAEALGTLAG
ncbi:MAG TPA: PAS domain-containing protein [Sphingomonas sp.]|nr:PAS domain-containing protein [Sphingomonas sp.]